MYRWVRYSPNCFNSMRFKPVRELNSFLLRDVFIGGYMSISGLCFAWQGGIG